MAATATEPKTKSSTYSLKMELRDGKPVFAIPKKHREAFQAACERASQYASLGMEGLSAEARAAADAIDALLHKLA